MGQIGVAFCIALWCMLPSANAGTLHKEDVQRMVGETYLVGEAQADMPAWPLFAANGAQADTKPELKAYGFETNDFASVRGYSGKPINMLVVLDLRGRFLDMQILDHREPIFLRPEGTAKLQAYALQHKGLNLRHTIQLGRPSETASHNSQFAYLPGVQTGTISAKAISRTLMTAAANIAVAARLSIPESQVTPIGGNEPTSEPSSASATSSAKDSAKDTKDSVKDAVKDASKDAAKDTAKEPSKDQTRDPARELAQATLKDVKTESTAPDLARDSARDAAATPDSAAVAPAQSADNGTVATTTTATAAASSTYAAPAADEPDWVGQWRERRTEIMVVLAALALLSVALIAQKRFSSNPRRLRILRTLYLLFTLGFIGWTAQGQLTIVNVTAGIESLVAGDDLSFLMNDPVSVILWIFTGITLLVWGRGTFCGWLCPFGALQELISLLSNAIGIRQRRIRTAIDAKLKWIKYGLLAMIIASVFIAPGFASWAVEIEPFKTAISLYFMRSWPYVLWAGACLALTVFVYRGYCRYICPLGAALASVSFLRTWGWLARRDECGTPCQSCRHRCEYQAIEQSGKINYSECFQCLDCVSIYQDEQRCLPLIQEKKRNHPVIAIQPIGENA
jgi:polyferredoxin